MKPLLYAALALLGTVSFAQKTKNVTPEDVFPSARAAVKETPAKASKPVAPAPPSGQFDAHWLQADEYLITLKEPLGGRPVDAWVGKLVTPATAETKQEAEFFIINGNKKGQKLWTKFYWLTQAATADRFKLGDRVFFFSYTAGKEGALPPKDRDQLLKGSWSLGTVTDMSELYKHYLSSGNYKISDQNLRQTK